MDTKRLCDIHKGNYLMAPNITYFIPVFLTVVFAILWFFCHRKLIYADQMALDDIPKVYQYRSYTKSQDTIAKHFDIAIPAI